MMGAASLWKHSTELKGRHSPPQDSSVLSPSSLGGGGWGPEWAGEGSSLKAALRHARATSPIPLPILFHGWAVGFIPRKFRTGENRAVIKGRPEVKAETSLPEHLSPLSLGPTFQGGFPAPVQETE